MLAALASTTVRRGAVAAAAAAATATPLAVARATAAAPVPMPASARRAASTFSPSTWRLPDIELVEHMRAVVPAEQERVRAVRAKCGGEVLGTCTVDQAYGGMRSVKSMVTETSLLDPDEGIRFRGYSIPECRELLTKAGDAEPDTESVLYLLLTGEAPTDAARESLRAELGRRAALPADAARVLDALPRNMHPMSQLVSGVMALQTDSVFAAAYQAGFAKTQLWEAALDDTLTLVARLPGVAARIYRNSFFDGSDVLEHDPSLDLAHNYARMLGFESSPRFDEFVALMRLYLFIHADHEGGNVSAHTTHLVGSALADPYTSYAAGMCGLAGPLHGLANQEVLSWLQSVQQQLGKSPTDAEVEKYLWDTLNAGRVVPGYGHAVLRKTDPRYTAQREFALKYMPEDPLFKLVSQVYNIAPKVLTEHGKAKNPYPNVDSHSGCLLVHYGLTQETYYTVMFGVSRALGVLSSLVIDRALLLPIERPKSVTTGWLEKQYGVV